MPDSQPSAVDRDAEQLRRVVLAALASLSDSDSSAPLAALDALTARAAADAGARQRFAELERRIDRGRDEIATLAKIYRSPDEVDDLQGVLDRAVRAVADALRVDAAFIRLLAGGELVLAARHGLAPASAALLATEPAIDAAPLGRGFATVVGAPLTLRGHSIGVLAVAARRPHRLDADDIRLLEALAAATAIAIENARFREAERRRALAFAEISHLKTDFALSVSHELRTPMAVVKASLDALDLNWKTISEERRRGYVALGRRGANRLKRLLENLMLVSRVERGSCQPRREAVDVGAVATSAVAAARVAWPRRTVALRAPASAPTANADRALVSEVLSYLLESALKRASDDDPILIALAASDAELVVRVGGADEFAEPSTIASVGLCCDLAESGGSAGLGVCLDLQIARRLVTAMGGRVWAEIDGQGRTAYVLALPLSVARARGPEVATRGAFE